jgi:hypothetical protein
MVKKVIGLDHVFLYIMLLLNNLKVIESKDPLLVSFSAKDTSYLYLTL